MKTTEKLNSELSDIMPTLLCCYKKCKKDAVGHFGVGDPDIKPVPLCEEHKHILQMKMFQISKSIKQISKMIRN